MVSEGNVQVFDNDAEYLWGALIVGEGDGGPQQSLIMMVTVGRRLRRWRRLYTVRLRQHRVIVQPMSVVGIPAVRYLT